jgi:hypothetical protein
VNFREHVQADVESWTSATLRETWHTMVETNGHGDWAKFSKAEVELRAWVETRSGPDAREPVVLNRHHLTPVAPQAEGKAWPIGAVYAGRAPSTAPRLDSSDPAALGWRISHLLGNPWDRRDYPDALERYRLRLRGWMQADAAAAKALAADPRAASRRVPEIDAIRGLTPRSALVCSCVSSPWTPEINAPYPAPLPSTVVCHCHLIVAAWRALNAPARAAGPAAPRQAPARAAAGA